MKVKLAYGREGLYVDFPDERTTVIEPGHVEGLSDEGHAITAALKSPLGCAPLKELAERDHKVAISVCDVTRAIPTSRILPRVLAELEHVPREQVSILVATGTHRATSIEELREILGPEIVAEYRVANHDCLDSDGLVLKGRTDSGIPIWLNRSWVESDCRITIGFVEPHFFAGFSGGPKMVAPGLAGLETILALHSADLIAHPKSTWGITRGNPIHDSIREIVALTGVTFSVDVTLNRERDITGVFAGEQVRAHRSACELVRESALQAVDEPFDVVVTTNSGYPLDLNLYQSVKGMSAAARVVRPNGVVICAAECSDGIPEHGEYGEILAAAKNASEILEIVHSPGYTKQDQWQAQIQAQIQEKVRVYVKSSYLSPEQVRSAHLDPVVDIESLLTEEIRRVGSNASICVLPEGPQTIPYLKGSI